MVIKTPEDGIDALLTGEALAGHLRSMACLNQYYFGSSLLTAINRPDTTRVTGCQRRKELGERVKKGEMRNEILGPHKRGIVN